MIEERPYVPLGKHHNWIERDKGSIEFELIIRENQRKIDRFIWNTSRKFKEIIELLRLKYGMEYRNSELPTKPSNLPIYK